MIRVTQSFTIRKIIEKLTEEGYNLIYKDLPHGRRGGIGSHGKINLLFERLFDRSPDILAIKGDSLMVLIEVNHNYKESLNNKFNEYLSKKGELLDGVSDITDTPIKELEFGFGIAKKKFPNIEVPFKRFHKFYLSDNYKVVHEVSVKDDA